MPTIQAPRQIRHTHLFNPGLPQAKEHRHVASIYTAEKSLRLTMVDVMRLFADRPDIRHFDDLRRLDLLGELEDRVAAYDAAGGNITFSSVNCFMLTTPEAFSAVPGAQYLTLTDCIKSSAA
jgi:hypothetical protein